jgi:pyruvate/2-oxoglutarate dehydrogenase complex dihydrolipoamide acyltransferase (E2) component
VSPKSRETQGTNESVASGADEQKAAHEWGHEGYISTRDEQADDDTPTLMLDVPVLNVDEINLEVEDLRAHVSLRAELADLVKINVGVDIFLDKVKLDIKGLEAQALLKIKLDRVLGTLDRALEAIDKNPQILNRLTEADSAVGDSSRGASQSAWDTEQYVDGTSQQVEDAAGRVDEATQPIGGASARVTDETERSEGSRLDNTGDEASQTVQRARNESGNVTEPAPDESNQVEDKLAKESFADLPIEEEYIDERGRIVGRARDESGNVVEEVLDEDGDVLDLSMTEEEDRGSEDEDDSEVDATTAARRKADELGVNLSNVKGTGSNGRVLVKDVERTAE